MAESKDLSGSHPGPTAQTGGSKTIRERGGWLGKIAPGIRNLVSKRETPGLLGSWVGSPWLEHAFVEHFDLLLHLLQFGLTKSQQFGTALVTHDELIERQLPALQAGHQGFEFLHGGFVADRRQRWGG